MQRIDREKDDEKDNVTSQEKAQGNPLLIELTGTEMFTGELMRRAVQ